MYNCVPHICELVASPTIVCLLCISCTGSIPDIDFGGLVYTAHARPMLAVTSTVWRRFDLYLTVWVAAYFVVEESSPSWDLSSAMLSLPMCLFPNRRRTPSTCLPSTSLYRSNSEVQNVFSLNLRKWKDVLSQQCEQFTGETYRMPFTAPSLPPKYFHRLGMPQLA
jgi:hypothetical protein